jgi:tetrapyrrole methylase family protein/MazG family protein/ATP diphosphatase
MSDTDERLANPDGVPALPDPLTAAPSAAARRAGDRFARLVDVVAMLRSPQGCPWDREQTLQTLRPFVLEEVYEVLQAIDAGDRAALGGEIGDFLFEGVLLAQLAAEAGDFTVADSLQAIVEKLVRRHPHVFGTAARARSSEEVLGRWEELKARERRDSGEPVKTILGGVPKTLPALLRAYEMSSRAAAVKFDWERATDVIAKIEEEVAEVRGVVDHHAGDRERLEEEIGDLLFAIANLSRKLGVEPESALRRADDKFDRRFTELERRFQARGRSLQDSTLDEMESEWGRIKQDGM